MKNNYSFFQKQIPPALWIGVGSGIVFTTILIRFSLPIRDSDLFFHLALGKFYFQNMTMVVDHSIFSWTPSTNDAIYCTWLSDVVFYLTHRAFGLPGIFILRYLFLFLYTLTGYYFACKLGLKNRISVWLMLLMGVLISYAAIYAKPEIFSFLFLSVITAIWFAVKRLEKSSVWLPYLIPIIMLIWVNCHGAFIFGHIFLILVIIGELFNMKFSYSPEFSNQKKKKLILIAITAILISVINPYGLDYLIQVYGMFSPKASHFSYAHKIQAYAHPFSIITRFHSFYMYADIALVLFLYMTYKALKIKEIDWSSIIVCLAFTTIYSLYLRTTYFFASTIIIILIYLYSYYPQWQKNRIDRLIFAGNIIPLIALVCISCHAIYNAYRYPPNYTTLNNFEISVMNPVDAADFIATYYPQSKIGNTYESGAYLIWKLWPDSKVSIDARQFPYMKWYEEYSSFRFGDKAEIDNFVRKYKADLWVIPHSIRNLFGYFITSQDWKLVFVGRRACVFVPSDKPYPIGNSYSVAKNIADLHTQRNIYELFLIIASLHDWKTANIILETTTSSRKRLCKKTDISLLKDIQEAMAGYSQEEYEKVAAHLSKYKGRLPGLSRISAYSIYRLAEKDLAVNKADQAVGKAVFVTRFPNFPAFCCYNSGLIILKATKCFDTKKADEFAGLAYRLLERFVNVYKQKGLYSEFVDYAQSILQDKEHRLNKIYEIPLIWPKKDNVFLNP
jgi:hypothetical protein